jgi:hypothetical protein
MNSNIGFESNLSDSVSFHQLEENAPEILEEIAVLRHAQAVLRRAQAVPNSVSESSQNLESEQDLESVNVFEKNECG